MKIEECISKMSKMYLDRLISSFSKDIYKFDETDSRNFISKNIKDIKQSNYIFSKLDFSAFSYKQRLLMNYLLVFLLSQPNQEIAELELYEKFNPFLKDFIKRFKSKEVLQNIDNQKIDIVKTIYEVIVADSKLSGDEERILQALRKKLNLTEVELNAIMNMVRKIDLSYSFSNTQIDSSLKELQCLGLVYYLNFEIEPRKFVVPKEIVNILTKKFNYPLDFKSFSLLLDDVSNSVFFKFIKIKGLKSASKGEMIQRLWNQGYSAKDVLEIMTRGELVKLAGNDKGIKISASKNGLIEQLLTYFFKLNTKPLKFGKNLPDNELWEYYLEIAGRKYGLLRELGIIKKDSDIENLFEKLTRFAFSKLCGLKLLSFYGNNNPDGGVFDEPTGEVLLWDNKSQELSYSFPLGHQKQFLQYVVKSKKPVISFLVITNEVDNQKKVEKECIRLSGEARVNIGVISAKTFKDFVDKQTKSGKGISPQTFNCNGVITGDILDVRQDSLK